MTATGAPPPDSWERHRREVADLATREARLPRRDDVAADGTSLYQWMHRQRRRHREGALSAERETALEAIPGWQWGRDRPLPRSRSWHDHLEHLREFVTTHGRLPEHQEVATDGSTLGVWVTNQRSARRAGSLPSARATALETVPGWSWDSPNSPSMRWDTWYVRLSRFTVGHGRLPTSHELDEKGNAVGEWLATQRRKWRAGHLDPAQRALLRDITGWAENGPETWDETWQRHCDRLRQFVADHDRLPTVKERLADGTALGKWVRNQRDAYRRGDLATGRAAALAAVPGWTWEPRSSGAKPSAAQRWEDNLAAVCEFVLTHGRLPRKDNRDPAPDERRLGAWVVWMRRQYREGTLTEARRRDLETVPGWWWRPAGAPGKEPGGVSTSVDSGAAPPAAGGGSTGSLPGDGVSGRPRGS